MRAATLPPLLPPEGRRAGVLADFLPQIVITPTLIATFVYVFLFCGWTIWISLSRSTLLPDYSFQGFGHYVSLWTSRLCSS